MVEAVLTEAALTAALWSLIKEKPNGTALTEASFTV
jgi:hypothetical protein